MTTEAPARPAIAPLDGLGREIQEVLVLVSPRGGPDPSPAYTGYGDAAAEAYFHLAREDGLGDGLRVEKLGKGPASQWWLVAADGRIIDLTLSPADRRARAADPGLCTPYEEGRGAMFRTGATKPSKRAAAIIGMVRARREA